MFDSCNPMDCSPPDSSVHGILQSRIWSGLPFPSLGDLPDTGLEPMFPALQADSCLAGRFFINWATREAPKCIQILPFDNYSKNLLWFFCYYKKLKIEYHFKKVHSVLHANINTYIYIYTGINGIYLYMLLTESSIWGINAGHCPLPCQISVYWSPEV